MVACSAHQQSLSQVPEAPEAEVVQAEPTEAVTTEVGTLGVQFNFMPPGEVYPTYDTAIWLEDQSGELVKTLFVSQVLSDDEYDAGDICPDWAKKADWGNQERAVVDAVTEVTPLIGGEEKYFDLAALGVPSGTYVFLFEAHMIDEYNVLFRGEVSVGDTSNEVSLERVYVPEKWEGNQTLVDSIRAVYFPKAAE